MDYCAICTPFAVLSHFSEKMILFPLSERHFGLYAPTLLFLDS
jgi:hypothetical protein